MNDSLRFGRSVEDVQISANGRWLAVVEASPSGDHGTLEVWDPDSRRRVASLDVPDTPTAVRFAG